MDCMFVYTLKGTKRAVNKRLVFHVFLCSGEEHNTINYMSVIATSRLYRSPHSKPISDVQKLQEPGRKLVQRTLRFASTSMHQLALGRPKRTGSLEESDQRSRAWSGGSLGPEASRISWTKRGMLKWRPTDLQI